MQIYYTRTKCETVTFDEYEYLHRRGLIKRKGSRLWFVDEAALDQLDQYRIFNDLCRDIFGHRDTLDADDL